MRPTLLKKLLPVVLVQLVLVVPRIHSIMVYILLVVQPPIALTAAVIYWVLNTLVILLDPKFVAINMLLN